MRPVLVNHSTLIHGFILVGLSMIIGCAPMRIERNIAYNQSLDEYDDAWFVPGPLKHKVISRWRIMFVGEDKVSKMVKDYEATLAGGQHNGFEAKHIYKFADDGLIVKSFFRDKNNRQKTCTFLYKAPNKSFFAKNYRAHAFVYRGKKNTDVTAKKDGNCMLTDEITFPIAKLRDIQLTPSGPFQAELSATVSKAVSLHWELQKIRSSDQVVIGPDNELKISPRALATPKRSVFPTH